MQELFQKELPKWPALVVKGKPVTEAQAKEILIRTSNFSFCSNDREFERGIHKLLYGVECTSVDLMDTLVKEGKIKKGDWQEYSQYTEEREKKYEPLELAYLQNSRIVSSWIGGPHGWCDWNGKIYTTNYNIGKWPSIEDVYKDWVEIAEAFPYLELKCQLMNHEAGEEDAEVTPVIEFSIKKGKVEIYEPKEVLDYPVFGSSDMVRRFSDPFAERGCTLKMFEDALKYTEERLAAEKNVKTKEFWKETK